MIDGFAQKLSLEHRGRKHTIKLPLVGEFQIENALVAAGLAIGTGSDAEKVFASLEQLEGAKGRLERVGERNGAPIFVDYAHKPDALAKALQALRPYAKRKLVVVFGAGGDRDAGKRPLMGAIAIENADSVIVTDDNPRSENPSRDPRRDPCRGEGRKGHRRPRRSDQGAVSPRCEPGDALLIAGKGHETGQIVGDKTLPFSDHDAVAAALGMRGSHERKAVMDDCRSCAGAGPAGKFSRNGDRFRDAGQPAGEAGQPVRGAERHAERWFYFQLCQRARRLGVCQPMRRPPARWR